jgi:hypothetical protein
MFGKLSGAAVAVALLGVTLANAKDPNDRAALDLAIYAATRMPPHQCWHRLGHTIGEPTYLYPLIINRALGGLFAIDTGFTGNLTIPRNQVKYLRDEGILTKGDSSGPLITSTLADGSEITQETIIIREIILPGCRAFRNVRATVSPANTVPLLGQGILSQFSSVAIDHSKEGDALILIPKELPP